MNINKYDTMDRVYDKLPDDEEFGQIKSRKNPLK